MSLTRSTRFIAKVAAFVPLLVMVAAVNYVVDPANVFHAGSYETVAADVLLSGANVDRYRAGDERLLQKLYIGRMPGANHVAAIGSSRMLQLRAADVGTRSFFNHGLFGATIRDAVAIYGMLRKAGRLPRVVILGLDPWTFRPASEDGLVRSLSAEYDETAALLGVEDRLTTPAAPLAEVRELVSLRAFQTALSTIVIERGLPARATAVPTHADEGEAMIKRHDGSVAYARELRQRSVEAVRVESEAFLRTSPYASNAFATADPGLLRIFEALLDRLAKDGIAVVLWRAPLHPLVYQTLSNQRDKHAGIEAFEDLCRRLASRSGVALAGAFDPAVHDLAETDFYDGFHPTADTVKRMISASDIPSMTAVTQ